MKYDFTIRSTELKDYNKRHNCHIVKVVDENKILVEVSPPFPAHVYRSPLDFGFITNSNKPVGYDKFVLAPRYEDSHLVPEISEWPLRVHICIPKEQGDWEMGPYKILDWGIIEKI